MNSLHNKLLGLPLFLGMNKADLDAVIGQTKFGFTKFDAGHVVVAEHAPCDQLRFLLSGTLAVENVADDHGYRLVERVGAPTLLQPEHLFGLHQHHTRTFTAETDCQLMMLDKNEVMRLTEEYVIFRLNLFNILSTQSQKQQRALWHNAPSSLSERIVRFILSRCLLPTGEKTLHIKMTRLADELNDSRLDISRALNALQADGLLTLHRGRIVIPAAERLPHRK